jgi:hypothetical protein
MFLITVDCTTWHRGMSYFHYSDNLGPLLTDKRVLVEGGDFKNAQIISRNLDSAINMVQTYFNFPFSKPIYISLCSSEKSHIKHCGDYKNSRGMMNWERIFLAPSAFESKTEKSILVHELVHLHTCQRLGTFKFIGNIPAWFSEGLAVMISNGAGAEDFSDSAAIDWINNDKCFSPTKSGNIIKTSGRNDSHLPWEMFYRQSSLFVIYLEKTNPTCFRTFLNDIENKIDFQKAFVKNFNSDIKDKLDIFKEHLKTNKAVKKPS